MNIGNRTKALKSVHWRLLFCCRLSVPESTPFTAVLKFAAEEVSAYLFYDINVAVSPRIPRKLYYHCEWNCTAFIALAVTSFTQTHIRESFSVALSFFTNRKLVKPPVCLLESRDCNRIDTNVEDFHFGCKCFCWQKRNWFSFLSGL